MFYKAIALSLLMFSNIVQANCPELDSLPRPDNNLTPKLAWGSDADRNTLKYDLVLQNNVESTKILTFSEYLSL